MNNKIVIDIETKKTFAEVGGLQSNHHLLGISFIGVFSYSQNKYFGFLEKDINILEKILIKERPQIIGYNTIGFDNKVLQPYLKNININDLPQLDLLAEITKELKFRIKLESAAQATLGEGKSGTGLDAIKYFREKDFESLAKYCLDDVRITKDLYEYGKAHGKVYYTTGGLKTAINIKWGDAVTIEDIIKKAYQQHQRLAIKYYLLDDKNVKTEWESRIDILSISTQKIMVYCHTKGKKIEILIPQILSLAVTDENYAYQTSLI